MKTEILERIKQLGGNVDNVKGSSLKDDLLAITFDTVLYQRPVDTPWASAEEEEPIFGIGDFIDENTELLKTDKQALYDKIIDKYFRLTEDSYGQSFWQPVLFTPFKEGTADFEEWNSDFTADDTDLSEIIKVTNDKTPDFLQLFYTYSYPDNFYICLSDPDPENTTLFGTDHTVFFREVTNEGTLEDFINTFMTKDELLEIVRKQLEK
ncbi:hypothetical protein NG800_007095 [Epilithonimonas ginsengisoli]|uniref:SMI1/KNR4 family protein n=1 Tax=Epilithonimonas ginsengisoli TaxID=1245592 RepID=A0ABU4JG75_9FLAO|nr:MULTISPECIES: hypothetical protein [Chryseobacterium group]MBV6880020.1 hypothetical protein [Epilithonimonas sp. FP105]MDW8548670.1 hypothetical protein [Epilithonimonas ginsengisoli]OAH75072.1 hypothetical protein AXA65_05185 [Chryseobacterium sp. FP211-J200]